MRARTETGAYDLTDSEAIRSNKVVREEGARFYLPTRDEWFKSAYYDPRNSKEGGPTDDGHYWKFPTMSDQIPTLARSDSLGNIVNDSGNIVNYQHGTRSSSATTGFPTVVGSGGPGSESFYGVSGAGGNVIEWTETVSGSNKRWMGGTSWAQAPLIMDSNDSRKWLSAPTTEGEFWGFRVAKSAFPEGAEE